MRKLGIAPLVAVTCAAAVLTACTQGAADGANDAAVTAAIEDVRIRTPGEVTVIFTVSHQGTSPATMDCSVTAGGATNTVAIPDVAPEVIQQASVNVEVPDSSAETVAANSDATVTCRAQ